MDWPARKASGANRWTITNRNWPGWNANKRAAGGEQIEELERERARVERERDERLRRRAQIEQACRQLGTALAAGASGFAAQVEHAQTVLENGKHDASALDEAIAERMGARRDDERRFAEIRAELEALKRAPSSMPAPMQALRARLCEDTGIAEAALPFVGELVQVREDQAAWRGAIERVLSGFAQSLLVDDRHYAQVSEWVNRTHIGTRLVYFRVRRNDALHARTPDARALPGKLQLRDHAFTEWLRNELMRRFDYECVDNAAALRNADRAITREGQVKHPGDRYEKDDRHAVNDRKRWLLGHDNRDKLKVFEREAQTLAQRIAGCDADAGQLRRQREQDQERQLAAHTLVERDWDEIDVGPKLQRLSDIDEQLQQLREGNSGLRALGQAIETARTLRDQAKRTYEDVRLSARSWRASGSGSNSSTPPAPAVPAPPRSRPPSCRACANAWRRWHRCRWTTWKRISAWSSVAWPSNWPRARAATAGSARSCSIASASTASSGRKTAAISP